MRLITTSSLSLFFVLVGVTFSLVSFVLYLLISIPTKPFIMQCLKILKVSEVKVLNEFRGFCAIYILHAFGTTCSKGWNILFAIILCVIFWLKCVRRLPVYFLLLLSLLISRITELRFRYIHTKRIWVKRKIGSTFHPHWTNLSQIWHKVFLVKVGGICSQGVVAMGTW